MASLDSLPADHRAVLQLVLQRGRSYDDIAALLSIDRAAVRQRALSALDALGPQTGVPPERRALITDYLLGQLPARVSEDTRDRLAETPAERAWARVVSAELAPLAGGTLPEIPTEATRREPVDPPPPPRSVPPRGPGPARGPEPGSGPGPARGPEPGSGPGPARGPEPVGAPRMGPGGPGGPPGDRPSSRRGGALLLAALALLAVIVVVVLVVVLSSGGSTDSSSTTAASIPSSTAVSPTATTGTTTTTSSTGTATAKPIGQVNLSSPTGGKAKGVAIVVRQGTTTGLVIRATAVPANTRHDAYAVWLYNSASDDKLVGFVNPGVGTTQVLQTQGPLPANASHFKQLLVTVETQAKPKGPGTIVLQGPLTLH
jgi:hypothetical protein